jgi:hypothetical protein
MTGPEAPMAAAIAAATAGTAIRAITVALAAMPVEGPMAAVMEAEVMAAGAVAIEAMACASLNFRFIPVWADYQFGIASKHRFSFCISRRSLISKSSASRMWWI